MAEKKGILSGGMGCVVLVMLMWGCYSLNTTPAPSSKPTVTSQFETIDLSEFTEEIVTNHPEKIIAMSWNLEFEEMVAEYDRLHDLANDDSEEFLKELESGNFILIPDGTRVKVHSLAIDKGFWKKITFIGKEWWIVGNFFKD